MQRCGRIEGIESLLEYLPEGYRHWHHFGRIAEFQFRREFDLAEKFEEIACITMVLTDRKETYRIRLHLYDVQGDVHFNVYNGFWSGLTIEDHAADGWDSDRTLVLTSFEQGCDVNIHCRRIAAEIVEEVSGDV